MLKPFETIDLGPLFGGRWWLVDDWCGRWQHPWEDCYLVRLQREGVIVGPRMTFALYHGEPRPALRDPDGSAAAVIHDGAPRLACEWWFDRWMDALDIKRAHGRSGVAEMGSNRSRLLGLVRRG